MLKKTLKMAGIGFLIGVVAGNLIAVLTGNSDTGEFTFASRQLLNMSGGSPVIAMILQSLLSGVYGAACLAGVVFYDIERMPLAAATALHCGVIVLLYVPIALILGWAGGIELLVIAGMQIAAFFIIWLILYFVYKKQVRELNEMQEGFSKRDRQGDTDTSC